MRGRTTSSQEETGPSPSSRGRSSEKARWERTSVTQFFDGIPPDLEEAAIVDGASRLRVYCQVWMPLARPAIAAVGVFTFVLSWNNFIWPFVVVTNTDMMTMPVGLATVQSSDGLRYADIMASAVLGGLPLLIVFLFFQRQIVQGIASTGLKG